MVHPGDALCSFNPTYGQDDVRRAAGRCSIRLRRTLHSSLDVLTCYPERAPCSADAGGKRTTPTSCTNDAGNRDMFTAEEMQLPHETQMLLYATRNPQLSNVWHLLKRSSADGDDARSRVARRVCAERGRDTDTPPLIPAATILLLYAPELEARCCTSHRTRIRWVAGVPVDASMPRTIRAMATSTRRNTAAVREHGRKRSYSETGWFRVVCILTPPPITPKRFATWFSQHALIVREHDRWRRNPEPSVGHAAGCFHTRGRHNRSCTADDFVVSVVHFIDRCARTIAVTLRCAITKPYIGKRATACAS